MDFVLLGDQFLSRDLNDMRLSQKHDIELSRHLWPILHLAKNGYMSMIVTMGSTLTLAQCCLCLVLLPLCVQLPNRRMSNACSQ